MSETKFKAVNLWHAPRENEYGENRLKSGLQDLRCSGVNDDWGLGL
ncbi:MAG: hypothetical protein MKZ95_01715 [Pirellulales bacterium]|nr:hypothetical protein [Pirellulales bacterium]